MQFKSAVIETTAKPQLVPIHDSITVVPLTTKTIKAFVDHSSKCTTAGAVTPVG